MLNEHICPLCNGLSCYIPGSSSNNSIYYACDAFYASLKISSDIDGCTNLVQKLKYFNLIFEHCMSHPRSSDHPWRYYIDKENKIVSKEGNINISSIPYPRTLAEKRDRILINLKGRTSRYGADFSGGACLARAFFDEGPKPDPQMLGITRMLIDSGYLSQTRPSYVSITAKGWERIDELLQNKQKNGMCFVAIAFRESTDPIREAIRAGAKQANFEAVFMDEKEYNNQIVPEMLKCIETSCFCIMDATVQNYGAYYEAGYALGKGKQVIITCKKEKFLSNDKPHFDINQYSIIVWEDEKDLVEKLEKRIRATIGEGKISMD